MTDQDNDTDTEQTAPIRPSGVITADGQEIDPQAFQRFVDEYPNNVLALELSEALTKAVSATQLYQKTSTFKLEVAITTGGGLPGELGAKTKVTDKPARATAPTVTFFADVNGGLSRRDPNQPQLPNMKDT